MHNSLPGYDAWLERPYQDMMDQADRFMDWMEENGYEPDSDEEYLRAEQDYEAWLNDMAESWYENEYEDAMDRKYDEMRDREMDYEYDYEPF